MSLKMKIHRGGNSTGSWMTIWPSSERQGGERGRLQRKWDKLPIRDFGTLNLAITTHFYWICVSVRELQAFFWTIKTEGWYFHLKKGKSSIQGGKAYVVEWGGAKKISPKDAMHLVVVLWIIVSFFFLLQVRSKSLKSKEIKKVFI